MRKLPSVSEMEHITSKEFGENMDAILDRVLKEDIALVIDHENKSYAFKPIGVASFRRVVLQNTRECRKKQVLNF